MREKKLVYLTAPQIGENVRVFCIRFGEDDYRSFINPIIETQTGFQLAREFCYSIPDKEFIRPRFNTIRFIYQTPMGKCECKEVKGMTAFMVQHCIDHLDGLVLSDIGLEIDEMFDNATDDERAEVIKLYMDTLEIKQKELDKQIEDDPDLKQMSDGIKFMNAVREGKVEFEKEEPKKK